eukprot:994969_1
MAIEENVASGIVFNWSALMSKLGFVLRSDKIHPNVQLRKHFYRQFHQNNYNREDEESIIDLDITKHTLEDCIQEYIKPLSNGDVDTSWIDPIIDSKHPEYDRNDRILGVDKNRCFIELADILMFRFLRWNGRSRKSNKTQSP